MNQNFLTPGPYRSFLRNRLLRFCGLSSAMCSVYSHSLSTLTLLPLFNLSTIYIHQILKYNNLPQTSVLTGLNKALEYLSRTRKRFRFSLDRLIRKSGNFNVAFVALTKLVQQILQNRTIIFKTFLLASFLKTLQNLFRTFKRYGFSIDQMFKSTTSERGINNHSV